MPCEGHGGPTGADVKTISIKRWVTTNATKNVQNTLEACVGMWTTWEEEFEEIEDLVTTFVWTCGDGTKETPPPRISSSRRTGRTSWQPRVALTRKAEVMPKETPATSVGEAPKPQDSGPCPDGPSAEQEEQVRRRAQIRSCIDFWIPLSSQEAVARKIIMLRELLRKGEITDQDYENFKRICDS